jgi:hypothetical protein
MYLEAKWQAALSGETYGWKQIIVAYKLKEHVTA